MKAEIRVMEQKQRNAKDCRETTGDRERGMA